MSQPLNHHAAMCIKKPPCRTREEMTKAHGTPAEFREACYNALGDISIFEARESAEKYERDWCAAPGYIANQA